MGDVQEPSSLAPVMRATLCGDGSPGPIEERLGRRLLRVVDPESAEGKELLAAGLVDLVGPGGERLGRIRVEDAKLQLAARLEQWLLRAQEHVDQELVQESLDRLRSTPPRDEP